MGERDDGKPPDGPEHPSPPGRPIPPYRREKERVDDEHLLGDDDGDITVVPVPASAPKAAVGWQTTDSLTAPYADPVFQRGFEVLYQRYQRPLLVHRQPVAEAVRDALIDWTPAQPGAAGGSDDDGETAAPPQFLFELQGEAVSRAAVLAGTSADLVFLLGDTDAHTLAGVNSEALRQAGAAGLAITLHATERGDLDIVGDRVGVARFVGGRMDPVRFKLLAANPPQHLNEPSSVHIDFTASGSSIHQVDLPITVVRSLAELAHEAPPLAAPAAAPLLDASQSPRETPDRRIRLSLSFAGGRLCIELTDILHGQDESEPQRFVAKDLDRGLLQSLLGTIKSDLKPLYNDEMWRWFDGRMPADLTEPTARVIRAALARSRETVAIAGASLNRLLREDSALGRAIDYIETQVSAGATITVSTDDIFLPWEILYPHPRTAGMSEKQKQAHPVVPADFWGARFAFETVQRVQSGSASLGQLRREQLGSAPRVSLNMNPHITLSEVPAERLPAAVMQAWADELDSKGQLDGGGVQSDCGSIREVLQDAHHDASLIYLYCHGNSPDPFGGAAEQLLLDDDPDCKPLGPSDLTEGERYPHAPIVFLNSCMSVAFSPLTFSSFLAEFKKRGALGMIGTSFSVPIVFGAHFGPQVVEAYLRRRGSLAVALLNLRREALLVHGNPVPLFYALQCQLDFGSG